MSVASPDRCVRRTTTSAGDNGTVACSTSHAHASQRIGPVGCDIHDRTLIISGRHHRRRLAAVPSAGRPTWRDRPHHSL